MKYYEIDVIIKGKKEVFAFKAETKADALALVKTKTRGLVVRVKEGEPPFEEKLKDWKKAFVDTFAKKAIKLDVMIPAFDRLTVMLGAGISIFDALKDTAESIEDPQFRGIMLEANAAINAGRSLTASLREHKAELGNLVITMVDLGEKTGRLDTSLAKLIEILEELRDNIKKFKKAMKGPKMQLGAMAGAFTFLVMIVVPKFEKMFKKFKAELPVPTKILLFLKDAFYNYGGYIVVGFYLIKKTIDYMYKASPAVKKKMDNWILNTYVIGDVLKYSTLHRFMLVFVELSDAGIPVPEALKSAIELVENVILKERLERISFGIEQGRGLEESFKEAELFDNLVMQMVAAGEASGQLGQMLVKIVEYYRQKSNAILESVQTLMEPIIMAFMTGAILLLATGIFLPMWGLGEAVNKD